MRSARAVGIGLVASGLLGGCITGFTGNDIEPVALVVSDDERSISLETTCAYLLQAQLDETDDTVSISEIDGTSEASSDCAALLDLELLEPLGDRAIVVEGEPWKDCRQQAQRRFLPPGADCVG